MSAERLRQAAERLRSLANPADMSWPAPWRYDRGEVLHSGPPEPYDRPFVCNADGMDADRFIATMHPGVALAVAAWLDEAEEHLSLSDEDRAENPCPTALEGMECSVIASALAVADAVLGES